MAMKILPSCSSTTCVPMPDRGFSEDTVSENRDPPHPNPLSAHAGGEGICVLRPFRKDSYESFFGYTWLPRETIALSPPSGGEVPPTRYGAGGRAARCTQTGGFVADVPERRLEMETR